MNHVGASVDRAYSFTVHTRAYAARSPARMNGPGHIAGHVRMYVKYRPPPVPSRRPPRRGSFVRRAETRRASECSFFLSFDAAPCIHRAPLALPQRHKGVPAIQPRPQKPIICDRPLYDRPRSSPRRVARARLLRILVPDTPNARITRLTRHVLHGFAS